MYLAIIVLTMLILPLASIAVDHAFHPDASLVFLTGRWFVFWAAGVRLALAGFRQLIQPEFTAREIFRMSGDEALPLVRELGAANLSAAFVALLSLWNPGFVSPMALYGAIFYGIAGVRHAAARGRSDKETVAMVSDVFIAGVFALYLVAAFAR